MSLISTKFCRRTVALCALLVALPTWAAVRSGATAAAGPVTAQVFDLRPEDGVAANVSFASQAFGAAVSATVEETGPFDVQWRSRTGSWQGTGVDMAASRTEVHAAITGGGANSPLGATMQLSGVVHDVNSPSVASSAYAAHAAMLADGQMLSFALTPWSAMSLHVDVSGALSTLRPGDHAEIVFELSLNTSTGMERFDVFQMACTNACSDANGRLLSLTLPNESDVTLEGLWTLNARVAGAVAASPVPEASSSALLMCGLALMGLVARRRTRA